MLLLFIAAILLIIWLVPKYERKRVLRELLYAAVNHRIIKSNNEFYYFEEVKDDEGTNEK